KLVTGVQTCALPILAALQQQVVLRSVDDGSAVAVTSLSGFGNTVRRRDAVHCDQCRSRSRILKKSPSVLFIHSDVASIRASSYRTEERRVGKEYRCR